MLTFNHKGIHLLGRILKKKADKKHINKKLNELFLFPRTKAYEQNSPSVNKQAKT